MYFKDAFHITYCTNVHPGQDWKRTFENIQKHVPKIKSDVAPEIPFGIGLRLSNKASEELNEEHHLVDFKTWLADNNCYVFTMNGFPYGNFHDEAVKDQVHAPDWTTEDRLAYTIRLFDQLTLLLPKGMSGGVSTSPISYKHWYTTDTDKKLALLKGAEQMIAVAKHLYEIEQATGVYLHLDIEPEPDGLLENSDEVLSFFANYLVPVGTVLLTDTLGLSSDEVTHLIKRHLTVCYDICHFSLAYEAPKDTFSKFKSADILVGKIQVSAALKILFNGTNDDEVWQLLSKFNEPTYLHQVTHKKNLKVATYNDLPAVLASKETFEELRAHFHIPIFLEKFGVLDSTQDQILKTIAFLKEEKITAHLEIETYTWDVLPIELKEDLSNSIIREINWLKEQF